MYRSMLQENRLMANSLFNNPPLHYTRFLHRSTVARETSTNSSRISISRAGRRSGCPGWVIKICLKARWLLCIHQRNVKQQPIPNSDPHQRRQNRVWKFCKIQFYNPIIMRQFDQYTEHRLQSYRTTLGEGGRSQKRSCVLINKTHALSA